MPLPAVRERRDPWGDDGIGSGDKAAATVGASGDAPHTSHAAASDVLSVPQTAQTIERILSQLFTPAHPSHPETHASGLRDYDEHHGDGAGKHEHDRVEFERTRAIPVVRRYPPDFPNSEASMTTRLTSALRRRNVAGRTPAVRSGWLAIQNIDLPALDPPSPSPAQ